MDPIITPGVALIGAGTWFADKILGPSAEAFGDQLKVYVTDRIRKIFVRAEQLSTSSEVGMLPPGFAFLTFQKASFSADDEIITDMWVNLILAAAKKYDNRYSIISDIISQLSGKDAEFLQKLALSSSWNFDVSVKSSLRDWIFAAYRGRLDWKASSAQVAKQRASSLIEMNIGWPVLVESAKFNWYCEGENAGSNSGYEIVKGEEFDYFSLDVLTRQCLVERFHFDFHPGWASPEMSGVFLTQLGRELLLTCDKDRKAGR